MTAVMILDDIPSSGVIRECHADRLALPAEITPEITLAVVERIAQGLHARGAVVVIYPAWRPEAGVRLVRMARSILRTDRVAGIGLKLPPLAFSLVADQLAYLSAYVKPGVLAGMAVRLSQEVYTGAWVNSVARLEHITTGFGEHISSYLPGTDFMVSAAPHPHVHRITSAHPVAPISRRPMDPVFVIAAHRGGDIDWLQEKLRHAINAQSVSFVEEQPLSSGFWGAKKYVEFVAFSGNQHALQTVLRSIPNKPCPWCGEVTGLEVCLFCGMTQRVPLQLAAPASPGAAPRPVPSESAPAAQPAAAQPVAQEPTQHPAPPQPAQQPVPRQPAAAQPVPQQPVPQQPAQQPAAAQPDQAPPPAPVPPRSTPPQQPAPQQPAPQQSEPQQPAPQQPASQPEPAAGGGAQRPSERHLARPAAGHQPAAQRGTAVRPPSRSDDIEFPPARTR